MKTTFILIFMLLAMFGYSQSLKDSKGFLPKEFSNLYFGMPFEEFKKVKKIDKAEASSLMEFRFEHVEKMKGDINKVTYYFDQEGKQSLYEFIIEYNNEIARDNVAQKLFGNPNNEGEWYFAREGNFTVKAWKFSNNLVIVGVLPGTEWEESNQK